MFYIPVRQLGFFDINQSFNLHSNRVTGKFMFYINFINLTHSNYFCKISTFFAYKGQKNIITSQTLV
ncbi:hypothetical protein DXZ79_05125 [Yersinia rochesterensis]|uniref:Uncharacterized protein n=1 Tax=Yersinia rochesterensis TaxID=1604335 RepID=A0A8D4N4G3_9GAMM|nr:hypothetical protein DXZ79_05125 [Yersinia rochesterensis]